MKGFTPAPTKESDKGQTSSMSLVRGFSLIETLVAIVVLVGAIAGPLTLASQGIKAASLFKNQLIASNLAQEGMELVHAKRDSNILQGKDWMEGITDVCGGSGCYIRYTPTDNSSAQITFQPCGGGGCPFFFVTPEGWYVQKTSADNGDAETTFRRTILVTNVVAGSEVKVETTLEWRERFSTLTFDAAEHLLKWP